MTIGIGPLPEAPRTWQDVVSQWNALILVLEVWSRKLSGDFPVTGNLITLQGRRKKVTLVTSATYTIKKTDEIIDCNRSGTIALTLPLTPGFGQSFIIQDASGDANTNNITVAPPSGLDLNGDTVALTLEINYGRVEVYYNGTQYLVA